MADVLANINITLGGSTSLHQAPLQRLPSLFDRSNGEATTCCTEKKKQIIGRNEDVTPAPELFPDIWKDATSDNRLAMFGFRRFRTSHLVNLKMLEKELERVDRAIYQSGLRLPQHISKADRLGLRDAKEDPQDLRNVLDADLIASLRKLVKEYDEALIAFNSIMLLETFSLADDVSKASTTQELSAHEKFKTRLMRVDLPPRQTSRDPIQHFLRKGLRRLWYRWNSPQLQTDEELQRKQSFPTMRPSMERTWTNTARIAEIVTRFAIALVAGAALIVPLAIMSAQTSAQSRLLVVAICIAIFCMVVSTLSKASSYEAMASSAAYAAVLTVFLSNSPGE